MDFPDIIYRNNNYVESLHVKGNNENKNIIFIRQFYIPKQLQCKETQLFVGLTLKINQIRKPFQEYRRFNGFYINCSHKIENFSN